MKKIFFILFFLYCILYDAEAQNEFYIPWTNDSLSLDGICHIVDGNGNFYILGVLNGFDTLQGSILPSGTLGNTVIKIDRNNNTIWKRVYYNNYPELYNSNYPGAPFLFLNSSIFLPYDLDIGFAICTTQPDTAIAASSLNAGILIDNTTGDTIKNHIFYDGTSCGMDAITFSRTDKNGNIYYIYSNDYIYNVDTFFNYGHYYLEKINIGFNIVIDTPLSAINTIVNNDTDYLVNIIYDSIGANYIVSDRYGIRIYDSNWQFLHLYNFNFFNPSISNIGNVHISYNANYYVVNCSISNDTSFYTIVLTKDGHLISCEPSFPFNDVLLTADNNIWGVASVNSDTSDKPLTLIEMDLFQNVKRKVLLGKPGVVANKLSLTNSDIIITGTVFSIYMTGSLLAPDVIYYYRQSTDEIPLLIHNDNLCNSITVYPNPAKNDINIESSDFNATYNSSIELYNILGQKLNASVFDAKTISLNLIDYPPGIYFLKIKNSDAACVTKIQKQ